MLEHPDAAVSLWGPGYEGWIDEQNMRSRFCCGEIDLHINFLGEQEGHFALHLQPTSSATALWSDASHPEHLTWIA